MPCGTGSGHSHRPSSTPSSSCSARARVPCSTVPVCTYLPEGWYFSSLAPQMHSALTVTYCSEGKAFASSQLAHSGLPGMHVLSSPSRSKASRQKALHPVDVWW